MGAHYQRSQIADFLHPDDGYRGKMHRLGHKVKDHMKENLIDLREKQNKLRQEQEDREEQERSVTNFKKLSQFQNVPSRVFEELNDNRANRNNQSEPTIFLGKGIQEKRLEELAMRKRQERYEMEERIKRERDAFSVPSSPRKGNIPRSSDEMGHLAPRSDVNFISRNKLKAQLDLPVKKRSGVNESPEKYLHEEFGTVPKYLEDRKTKMEEDIAERRRRMPDPDCPPGMKLMPTDERLSTLQKLNDSRTEAMSQLSRMPFMVENPSAVRRKKDLENKLKEIESAIDIFSKPKVFIQIE